MLLLWFCFTFTGVDVVFQVGRFDEVINHLPGVDPRLFAFDSLLQLFALVRRARRGASRRVGGAGRRGRRRADR